ncbi:MAG TPA: invasin domain 3-containing protein, partial [Urbifossiella sp.]|nr:invasin domain 3-containing protein [Urbifossiella sp.]
GYNGTAAAGHGANALVLFPTVAPALPAAPNYTLYFTQGVTATQYVASLYQGTPAGPFVDPNHLTPAGQLTVNLPPDIPNVELEGGSGDNWIQVDPSVTRNMHLYGGSGKNTLMAGSGNDTLVAGPGQSVLYGGTGDDFLYGGDEPTHDVRPAADPARTDAAVANPVEGDDTLIAGPGDDQLFAGFGNDVLIGGSVSRYVGPNGTPGLALLQNGQYQLVEGAGRDVLAGGSGADLLIAGPGSPGAVLEAGTGANTLVTQNYGVNVLSGGAGGSLLLGGNLENVLISNSAAGKANTLVGGFGPDTLTAGAGNDALYATYDAASWSAAAAVAAAAGVHIVPPQLFQGDTTTAQLQQLLQEEQTSQGLTSAQQTQLLGLLKQEFKAAAKAEDDLNNEVLGFLDLPNLPDNQTLKNQLQAVIFQDGLVQDEVQGLLTQIANALDITPFAADSLIGGSGNDAFYGNVHGATWMGGGTGKDTFYNFNGNDTIAGGSGTNTLVLQGDGAITLAQDATNVNGVDVTIPGQNGGQPWLVGDVGKVGNASISNIQVVAVKTGSANGDTVAIGPSLAALPPGLNGLGIYLGSGNATVDASAFTGNETLAAGSGNDVIKIGTVVGAASQITGSPTAELDIVDTTSLPVTVTAAAGLKIGSFQENPAQFATFGKLVVIGGSGTNTFTTDGSIPTVVLEGGSGSNTFNVSGGAVSIVGGSGPNSYNLTGPGTYTVTGAGRVNQLNLQSTASGDTIHLKQVGETVIATGMVTGAPVYWTATNLTGVAVAGSTAGNNTLDASGMVMGVALTGVGPGNVLQGGAGVDTLDGGAGGNDTLLAGNNNDILYVSGSNSTYTGAGSNILVYRANPTDKIVVYGDGLVVNPPTDFNSPPLTGSGGTYTRVGTFIPFASITGLGNVEVNDGAGTAQIRLATAADLPGVTQYRTITDLLVGDSNPADRNGAFIHLLPGQSAVITYPNFQWSQQYDNLFTTPPWTRMGFWSSESTGEPIQYHGQVNLYNNTSATQTYLIQDTDGSHTPYFRIDSLDDNDSYPGYDQFDFSWYSDQDGRRLVSQSIQFSPYPVGYTPNAPLWTGGTALVVPGQYPITGATVGLNAYGDPNVILGGEFTDPDPNAGHDTVVVDWGDGTTSAGQITPSGAGTFYISGSHSYTGVAPRTISITITDPDGTTATASLSSAFTGGLWLDGTTLDGYTSANTAPTQVDSNVAQFITRNPDGAVVDLHTDHTLWVVPASGGLPRLLDTSVQSFTYGPDGTLYSIHIGGYLYTAAAGTVSPTLVESGVQTAAADSAGNVYKLYANGSLEVLPAGMSTWSSLRSDAASLALTADGSQADIVTAAGYDWHYSGTAGALNAAPHLVVTAPPTVTAGQSVSVTVSLRDVFGNLVTGYTGTLSLADSDSAAVAAGLGPPFVGSGQPSVNFTGIEFLTSGTQTLTASDSTGLTLAVDVTVNPGAATQFSVDPPPVTVGTAVPVTVTAYDAYGNVATGYNGSVVLAPTVTGAATPVTYNISSTSSTPGMQTQNVTFAKTGGQKLVATAGTLTGAGAIVVAPGAVDLAHSTASVSPLVVGAGGQVAVTLTARDASGNPLTAGGLTVAFTLGAGSTSGGNFSATKDNGDGTYTAVLTAGPVPGLDTITASIGGQQITSSPSSLVVTAGAPDAAHSTLAALGTALTAGGQTTVTLTAADAFGNADGAGLVVAFSTGAGSAGGAFGAVTYAGNGQYTAAFTAGRAGTNTFTVSVGGQPLAVSGPGFTVTPGPVSPVRSAVTAAPTVAAGGSTTITLTARDASGNPLTGGGLVVAFQVTGGGSVGAVTDNRNGTYTAAFAAGPAPGTATLAATIGGQPVTSPGAAIAITPGPVDLARSTVAAAPGSVRAG